MKRPDLPPVLADLLLTLLLLDLIEAGSAEARRPRGPNVRTEVRCCPSFEEAIRGADVVRLSVERKPPTRLLLRSGLPGADLRRSIGDAGLRSEFLAAFAPFVVLGLAYFLIGAAAYAALLDRFDWNLAV